MSLTSQCFIIVGIADRVSHRAGADKKLGQKMINVASGDRNAIWLPRCRDALMASQQGRGKRHCRDGNVINGTGMAVRTVGKTKKKKRVVEGGKKKTKMTTKWNLINPDLVPSSDKFSAEEEEEGKLFFWDVFSSPPPFPPFSSYHSAFPPGLKRQRDVWVLTMLLLHLWND